MLQRTVPILENRRLAERTYRIRLPVPEIAGRIRPGQFVMLRLPSTTDPLLGRPFALYDTVWQAGEPIAIDVVYLVVGKLTNRLAMLYPGEHLEVWGPLGNGFLDLGTPEQVNLVAGGIGQTPFLAYARELLGTQGYGGDSARPTTSKVRLYYGVRTASLAAGVEDFEEAGVEVIVTSDDGSVGRHGRVTQILEEDHPPGPFVGCGPEPMLHALTKLAARWNRTCHVSLETPMACGFGVCFSCVTKVRTETGVDYRRVCVEGPVFDAACLVSDE